MRSERLSEASKRIALAAIVGHPCEVRCSVSDRIITPRLDTTALRTPGKQLFANVSELCT